MKDKEFINLANEEGEKALKRGDYPAGCLIVKDGMVIAKGSNSTNSEKDCTCHGEINGIRNACNKLNSSYLDGCIVYSNIEPCLMCGKAMVYAKVKRVVYGIEHGEYKKKKTFDILKQNGIGKDIEVIYVNNKKAKELRDEYLSNKK